MSIHSISSILEQLEKKCPARAAEAWDNVGLIAGDLNSKVTRVVVSTDLDREAVWLAHLQQAELIVCHHPPIFPKTTGISKLDSKSSLFYAIQQQIGVVTSHTNFDQCALEVIHEVAQGLKVEPLGRLLEKPSQAFTSLVTYAPESSVAALRKALSKSGAGQMRNYEGVSFASGGESTFKPKEGENPTVGKVGQWENVNEVRIETLFPKGLQDPVLEALRENHPYDEPGYQLFSVETPSASKGIVSGLGYGFWGDLVEPLSFSELSEAIKELFQVKSFWVTRPPVDPIRRIAFAPGKGSSFIKAAAHEGCQLFITGEVGYHAALSATQMGMGILELGHTQSELFFLKTMQGWFKQWQIDCLISQTRHQELWLGGPE